MVYLKISIKISPYNETVKDLLIAQMADMGYDAFAEEDDGFDAYIDEKQFDEEDLPFLEPMIKDITLSWSLEKVEEKNWNEEWEKNFFQPQDIDGKCLIHSDFHKTDKEYEYDIIINPKMAFGTGHHETTRMMVQFLLEEEIKDKVVVDMGCGTGILSILSSKRGATEVYAVDIDPHCIENAQENIHLNKLHNIFVLMGNATYLSRRANVDVIVANINRNVLIEDMDCYATALKSRGILLISGFYSSDVKLLTFHANKFGLVLQGQKVNNNWCSLKFVKP